MNNGLLNIEMFLQKEWIPTFIKNFISNREIIDEFSDVIITAKREHFETLLKELMFVFNEEVSLRRITLWRDKAEEQIIKKEMNDLLKKLNIEEIK